MILYDRLIPAAALDGARADAEVLFVGKEGGGPSVPQEQTEALILARAQAGQSVVRLKGGDPFVFGRGGEEALTLRDAGIPFEIVPGVTSGVAAAAYAGIPVTHRGLATAVALVTGHTPRGRRPLSEPAHRTGPALAAFPGTLVFYMGVRQLPQIAESLIAAGRPADEPVAIVERGTLPDQRTVTGTLQNIAEIARREQVRAPSITVVGPVAGLAGAAGVAGAGSDIRSSGQTVAVTRARAQASGLARRLEELGANVVQAPVIRDRADRPVPARPARTTSSASPARTRSLRCSSASRGGLRPGQDAQPAGVRRRARVCGRARGGDRPRHGARAGRARDHRGHRARALRRGGARAGARRRAGRACAGGAREGGARRAPGRAARARRRGRRAGAV